MHHCPGDIGSAGKQPDVTDHDIIEHTLLGPSLGLTDACSELLARGVGRQRIKHHLPVSGGIGHRGVCLPADFDGHLLAGGRRAPDTHGLVSLQNHPITKQSRHGEFCTSLPGSVH